MTAGVAPIAVVLAAVLTTTACTVHDTKAPPLSGPSESALSLAITATPDSISQDGASQSAIQVYARDPNGKAMSGLTLRMDMRVGGVVQDYGTLSARTVVTGNDGKATTVFTSPLPLPPGANTNTCAGTIFSPAAPGTCVDVIATPISTAYQTVTGAAVTLRLVPLGVILPPGATPTAAFTFSPTPVTAGVPVLFDASGSCAGQVSNGSCTSSDTITSYQWDFGDGTAATGKNVSHTFNMAATFSVTLTVTNSRGLAASTTKDVATSASAAPTAAFVFSPSSPKPGSAVFFNGATSTAGAGRTLVGFLWDFGDGSPRGSGVAASHTYNPSDPVVGATYTVVLTVTDDLGMTSTATNTVTVKQ